MPADLSKIGPFLLAAVVVFVIYRRLRRTFGKQPLQAARMIFRIVLFSIVGCLLAPGALRSTPLLGAAIAGIAIGVALAVYGAARTRFETTDGKLYYIPHTYTGIAVSLLFLGRLAYRFLQVYMGHDPAGMGSTGFDATGYGGYAFMVRSPLTLGMYYVLMGYYVCYYIAVLRKATQLDSRNLEAAPTVNGAE